MPYSISVEQPWSPLQVIAATRSAKRLYWLLMTPFFDSLTGEKALYHAVALKAGLPAWGTNRWVVEEKQNPYGGQKAMSLTLAQAAKETGKSEHVIAQAIQAEQLPAQKDEQGQWQIEPETLFQVFPLEETPEASPPPSAEASTENSREPLMQEIQRLRKQLQAQAVQAQARYEEWKRLMEQEVNERQRLTEALAAPLEEENQRLRHALAQAQKKNRELRHRLAQEAEARRQLTEELTEAQSPPPPAWARWLNRRK